MAGFFIRRKSSRELVFWLLDQLAALLDYLAAFTANPALRFYIPNSMIVCIYKDVSRDIEILVGETKNYVPRSEWNKIVCDLGGIAERDGYVYLDRNGERISVTPLSRDSVEFRFHAMIDGGVIRARGSDLAESFKKYREYIDAEEKS